MLPTPTLSRHTPAYYRRRRYLDLRGNVLSKAHHLHFDAYGLYTDVGRFISEVGDCLRRAGREICESLPR